MKRLGLSIYPEKSTLEEIKSYLKDASELGFSRVFSCLLSVNKPAEEIKNLRPSEIIGYLLDGKNYSHWSLQILALI